ncbi:uncharacterized protein BJ171DRAFT_164872 [Polychytrium aggregatum]|uniref:uncharacterized protein n=1 Tax=Polychytrium aggregatum TaxID=110093 RepID=UPI0022FE3883|nr:uncharacterized protein BJ171DRAFT_164872 [Polychytrium aggregatum]KAI9202630.1 hypothetical protein BJ171DRAFT_164872 [Polychytrium aggregatum]
MRLSCHTTTGPQVVNSIQDYRNIRSAWAREDRAVGFVPTMGALHEGHITLVREAKSRCDRVVVSIFVNPAQFAPTEDLDKYPRTMESDLALLDKEGVDVVFYPPVKEMYPSGITLDVQQQVGTFVEVKGKSHQMEGSVRPHFFRGVATVVSKLFNIVQPTRAFFGQKDGQQCSVIRSMVRDLFFPLELVIVPTVREADGLAMSSRNRYLSAEERAAAPVLFKALSAGEKYLRVRGPSTTAKEIIDVATETVKLEPRVQLEYFSLANPYTLEELQGPIGDDGAIFSGAVKVGKTRIIDNILLQTNVKTWATRD